MARLAKAEPRRRPAAERSPICWGRFVRREAGEGRGTASLSVPAFADDAERRGLVFTFDNGPTATSASSPKP